jgi:hypothetical protein
MISILIFWLKRNFLTEEINVENNFRNRDLTDVTISFGIIISLCITLYHILQNFIYCDCGVWKLNSFAKYILHARLQGLYYFVSV